MKNIDALIDRRIFFKVAATGVAGYFLSPQNMCAQIAYSGPVTILNTARNVIYILLAGAMSQSDTLDLRVGSWTPANFTPNTINGIDWPGGLLPELGGQLGINNFSIIRSCQSTALVHNLLQNWNQIARNPTSATGKIAPNIGSIVALETEPQRTANQKLPGFLSLNGGGSLAGNGYFPGKYAPFDVTPAPTGIANLANGDGPAVFATRYNMLQALDARTVPSAYGSKLDEMGDFYSGARNLMYDPAVTATFQFSIADRDRYGNSAFGNACVTARNVLWQDLGTRYIQITLGGWDNHQNIYASSGNAGIYPSARQLDAGLANLISDLSLIPGHNGRTLLDETLIVAKGEFGRTVGNITAQQGRDHYFVHSALVAGGGVRGGRVLGKTTTDGAYIDDPGWSQQRPVYAEDIAATIYSALGINYATVRHDDPLGRGFEYIPTTTGYTGTPVLELFQ